MKANDFIIRDARNMNVSELEVALEVAMSYDKWLNDKRNHQDKPVVYGDYQVHETKTGTIIVNKIS